MASDGSALVLLHGIGMSGAAWQEVIPLLSDHHQVHAPSALGHRGGPQVQHRPVTMSDVVDAMENYLDEHGLNRPHLAGNSMGGYIAIELARRGRAATVCALSPAGFWSTGDDLQAESFKVVKRNKTNSRRLRPLAPLLLKSATVRRFGMRELACHGERLSPARLIEMTDDGIASAVAADDLLAGDWQIEPLNPLPCPVTLAWSEKDAFLPLSKYRDNTQKRLPQATFRVLTGIGHVPMLDDPHLVAKTILAVTGATKD